MPVTEFVQTTWGLLPIGEDHYQPRCHCERCGEPLYPSSTGNYRWDLDGTLHGVCYACLRPEED